MTTPKLSQAGHLQDVKSDGLVRAGTLQVERIDLDNIINQDGIESIMKLPSGYNNVVTDPYMKYRNKSVC